MTDAIANGILKALIKRHKAKFGCSIDKKRCSACDKVKLLDLFRANSSYCCECYRVKQNEYYEKRVTANALKTGIPRKSRGRPFLNKGIVLSDNEDSA